MCTFRHLAGIWSEWEIMICILIYLFQTGSLRCRFVHVEGYKSFLVSATRLFNCMYWLFGCFFKVFEDASQGYRAMWWAKETDWHSALQVLVRWEVTLTLMWSAEEQTDKTQTHAHSLSQTTYYNSPSLSLF